MFIYIAIYAMSYLPLSDIDRMYKIDRKPAREDFTSP